MPVNTKQIRERVTKMSNAWAQGAPNVAFKGITQTGFQKEIKDAAGVDQEIADLEVQVRMKKTDRDERYTLLNDKSVKIRDGVEGDENFGQDHPIYEGMGFVRQSERKSGLTRKKNQPSGPKG